MSRVWVSLSVSISRARAAVETYSSTDSAYRSPRWTTARRSAGYSLTRTPVVGRMCADSRLIRDPSASR